MKIYITELLSLQPESLKLEKEKTLSIRGVVGQNDVALYSRKINRQRERKINR